MKAPKTMKRKGISPIGTLAIVFALLLTAHPSWAKEPAHASGDQALELARRGVIKANAGNFKHAIELFDASLKASSGNVTALFNRGKVFLLEGRLDRALQDLDKTIKFDPEAVDAYIVRGTIHRLQGDFSKAVRDLNKAVSLDPGNTGALINRAAVFFDTGRARERLGRSWQDHPA